MDVINVLSWRAVAEKRSVSTPMTETVVERFPGGFYRESAYQYYIDKKDSEE